MNRWFKPKSCVKLNDCFGNLVFFNFFEVEMKRFFTFLRLPIAVWLRVGRCEWGPSAIAAARGTLSALKAASDADSPPGAS